MKPVIKSGTRLAVIDLGSNTFHLLIANVNHLPPHFKELYRERAYIYISRQGLDCIPQEKIELACATLKAFKQKAEELDCERVKAIGTAAMRSASNAHRIVDYARDQLSLEIELISGKREAELIFKGTQCLNYKTRGRSMIMDIGGGSVEFVLQEKSKIIYAASHDIGISAIRKDFAFSEPVKKQEIEDFYNHLDSLLYELNENIAALSPESLIGSSGPFEILESMSGDLPSANANIYRSSDCRQMITSVLTEDRQGREKLANMPPHRADMSKEAFILINYFLRKWPCFERIVVSPYAIKEGVLLEMIQGD